MAVIKFLDLNGVTTLLNQLKNIFVKKSDVDSTLSSTSTNPIQNKTVNTALNGKANTNHTHNYAGSSTPGGGAISSEKLSTARTISLTGNVSGSVSFDGSKNVSMTTTVADDSHNHIISNVDGLQSALDGKVPTSRTINGKALSSNITLTPSEIGAATSNHTHTIANIDNLQTTLNGKANTSHTHNYAGSSSAGGVANSASKLATARTITLDGDVTGSASFDGSKNITITTKGVGEREHDMNTDGCYFEADLTASTYDQNTWYPIVGSELPTGGYTKISCNVQLDNTSHPSWGKHGSGFVCNFTIYAKEFGWGTTNGESYVTDWTYNWCDKNPLGYQQMSNSSRPVIFARGGGLYPIRSSEPLTWTICSTTFTDEQQSVSPTTTEPSITFNGATIHAHLSGNVVGNVTGNATTATTATKASTGSLNRVTHSYNEVPSITTYRWEEFSNSAANAPTAQWYHTFTGRGYDPAYATQLALGMTTNNLAYRRMDGNTWGSWDTILTSRNYASYVTSTTSATKLATARTINGTSFDGTANITTANWGTARTIKIGNTGKSVNGSNNVTWSLSEIGAAASSHTHNYAGSSSAGGAANSANKLNTNAGHTFAPVYFSNGVPVACTTGKRTNSIAVIGGDGVMEIGKYIDFHDGDGSGDFSVRMTASSGKLDISGTTNGSFTGSFVSNNWTDYTTSRCRNARFGTSAPSSLANGEIFFVYE